MRKLFFFLLVLFLSDPLPGSAKERASENEADAPELYFIASRSDFETFRAMKNVPSGLAISWVFYDRMLGDEDQKFLLNRVQIMKMLPMRPVFFYGMDDREVASALLGADYESCSSPIFFGYVMVRDSRAPDVRLRYPLCGSDGNVYRTDEWHRAFVIQFWRETYSYIVTTHQQGKKRR